MWQRPFLKIIELLPFPLTEINRNIKYTLLVLGSASQSTQSTTGATMSWCVLSYLCNGAYQRSFTAVRINSP